MVQRITETLLTDGAVYSIGYGNILADISLKVRGTKFQNPKHSLNSINLILEALQ